MLDKKILAGYTPHVSDRFANYFGSIFTNDLGYYWRVAELRERNLNGTGVFVGSGGLLSMLPELPGLSTLVCLDQNILVIDINRKLVDLLSSLDDGSSLDSALAKVYSLFYDLSPLPAELCPLLKNLLEQESSHYGELHWSKPSRFKETVDLLKDKEIIFLQADITDPKLSELLNSFLADDADKISFANFTNVHEWVNNAPALDIVSKWPFTASPTILYSQTFESDIDHPQMRLSQGLDEYFTAINQQSY